MVEEERILKSKIHNNFVSLLGKYVFIMISSSFIRYAADVLGDTDRGLSTSQIVEMCVRYAADYGVAIPHYISPLPVGTVPNKRTALMENLEQFSGEQQYKIIKDMCELEKFANNEDVKNLKIKLITEYSALDQDVDGINENLVKGTKHWLFEFQSSYRAYENALTKFKGKIFQRNLLDDLRLALELLLKSIFGNEKSLENQLNEIGRYVKNKGGSKEFSSMFQKLIEYYSKYQNSYIKHDDAVKEDEIEFIFEITSSFMKHLVKLNKTKA